MTDEQHFGARYEAPAAGALENINLSMVIVPRTEAVEYEERDENDPL